MDTLLLTRSAVQGLLNPAELLPELIENDEALGRISNHQITIYGSVGLAFSRLGRGMASI
ncbi:hypothetical protein CVD25_02395 [Bacillus canaveralius]|uniref:Uncharacterized protein n=1 Tax=Bacillus canaveralius TaxID=1403243 RepID=A0A2N5GP91_9BACI|nr:hypothetical protein [Bacillus canaveralius]PLR84383.1 hypothetical protein CU635_06400 [Bacillus canaveralius]PLS00615.1 hypothetical protein CVD25_02395 [Bacillus canaveralius]